MMVKCPNCRKEFAREYNIGVLRVVAHQVADNEKHSSVIEESSEESDHETEASDENGSSDNQGSAGNGDSSSDNQHSTDDEDENDSVWTSINDLSKTQDRADLVTKRLNWWKEPCQPEMLIKHRIEMYYQIWNKTLPWIISLFNVPNGFAY